MEKQEGATPGTEARQIQITELTLGEMTIVTTSKAQSTLYD